MGANAALPAVVSDPLHSQVEAVDGDLLPTSAGMGFGFDPAALARYGVVYPGESDRWMTVL